MADPTTDPTDTSSTLATLGASDRSHWRLTGELPTDTPSTDPSPTSLPDSSPAEPAEQVASTEAQVPPASEPGTPTTRKSNAESRKAELKAEIDAELARRATVRAEREAEERALADLKAERLRLSVPAPQTPPAASSPASGTPFPSYDQWVAADPSRGTTLDPYIDYLDARADARATATWEAKQRDARAQDEARTREQHRTQHVEAHKARFSAAVAADPEFGSRVDPRLLEAVPIELLADGQTPTAINVIAQEILLSEQGPALMALLSATPSEFDRLLKAPSMDVIVRGMGRLEASVSSVAPTAKVVSSAPPPPITVGARGAVVDDVESAGRSGDFRAYAAAMNRREIGASAPGVKR